MSEKKEKKFKRCYANERASKNIVSVWVKTHSMEKSPVFAMEFQKRPRNKTEWGGGGEGK